MDIKHILRFCNVPFVDSCDGYMGISFIFILNGVFTGDRLSTLYNWCNRKHSAPPKVLSLFGASPSPWGGAASVSAFMEGTHLDQASLPAHFFHQLLGLRVRD